MLFFLSTVQNSEQNGSLPSADDNGDADNGDGEDNTNAAHAEYTTDDADATDKECDDGGKGAEDDAADDGTVVISRADGQTLWSRQFSGTTRQLRPSRTADLIAASSDNGQLHLISPSPDRGSAEVRSIQTPHGRINLIRFNPGQSEVATAGADGTISLTPLDGKPQQTLVASTKGWSRGVAYCAGSLTTILSIGDDGMLRQWSQRGQLLASLTLSPSAPLTGVDCSSSGRQAVVVNGTGQLWLLNVNP